METKKQDFLDKLADLRAATCDEVPTPQMAVLVRLTARLRRSGILARCLQVGETVPDFEFSREDGSRVRLYDLLDRGPVVLNFFRGLWCTYCRTELEAYEVVRSRLERLGCTYLAVSPQPINGGVQGAAAELIYDRGNAIARKFDLVYELEEEELGLFDEWGIREMNDGAAELPLPATYLIAQDRTVAYRFVDADFRARCCPDDLMKEVDALQSR